MLLTKLVCYCLEMRFSFSVKRLMVYNGELHTKKTYCFRGLGVDVGVYGHNTVSMWHINCTHWATSMGRWIKN